MKLAIITKNMKKLLGTLNLKKLILIAFGMTTLGAIGIFAYVLGVISEIKPIMTEVDRLSTDTKDNYKNSEVESEALTKTIQLKRFLSFTKKTSEPDVLSLDYLANLPSENGNTIFENSAKLPSVLKNDCPRYRCIQNKVNFGDIAPPLWKGLLGIEDYRFLEHSGVDPVSIIRAIIVDIKSMKLVQGGSTLTQQLVKNLFLNNEKTFQRKIKEMIYALYIEFFYEKDQIITAYFNEVFWGTVQGVYLKGVDAASRAYFDKAARDIDEHESSILISLLKGPYFYHPINHTDRLKERVKIVFERLKQLDLISKDVEPWTDRKWDLWIKDLKKKDSETYLRTLTLFRKKTSVINDYEKFIIVEGAFGFLRNFKKKLPEKDLAIKIFIQPVNCEGEKCNTNFKFYSKLERDVDRAINEERQQIGSILKPLVYKLFLSHGKKLDDLVSTSKITLNLKSGKWTPRDSKSFPDQDITLLQALQLSKNRPLIRLAQEIGFETIEKDLINYIPNLMTPLAQYPAQLLGSVELSMHEIGDIYRKFTLDTCREINSGQISIEDSIFYHMAQADKTTIRNQVGSLMAGTLIFGKTGTTNNGNDNWYIASDGHLITVIWTGIEAKVVGEKIPLSGASSSFKLYENFIVNRGKRLSEIYCM